MNDDEEFERFKRLFMSKIDGTDVEAVDLSNISDEDIELFEQMMRDIVLPHLIMGGIPGAIDNVKVMRLNKGPQKPKDPDSDLTWLDKYL